MSTQRDFDSVVHDWLELGPTELSDRVTLSVRATMGRTRQRRLWPFVRTAIAGRGLGLSLAVAAAVVVIAVAAVGFGLSSNGIQVGSAASPSASAGTGRQLSFQVVQVEGRSPDAAALAAIREILTHRLAAAGIAASAVVTGDPDRVVIDLPIGADEAAIARLVTATGELTFVPLPPATYGTVSASAGGPVGIVDGQPLPNDPALVPLFTGDQIDSANPATDENGVPAVAFVLKSDAASKFAAYTSANVGNFFAIVLDGTVMSAPSINSAITDGSGIITTGTGADAVTQMNELVTVLRSGSLPFPLRPIASP